MRKSGIAILLLVVLGNVFLWSFLNRPVDAPVWTGTIRGVSFSPYQRGQDPLAEKFPTSDEIESDLRFLQGKVSSVRTYSSTDGMEMIPGLANKYGLRVTAGAWLDKDRQNNSREINNLIQNARTHDNIDRLIVGNEAVLRGDLSARDLAIYIKRVKAMTRRPVSTAEPWHVWIRYPELAKEVDFIAIHVLPYWEGIDDEIAVNWAWEQFQRVQKMFPNKPVMFGEVGWPSAGDRKGPAVANLENQAQFVRGLLNLAAEKNLDYFIMEAFDQPWKTQFEGRAGGGWGIWSVDRTSKYPMTGEIFNNPTWSTQATLASLTALLPLGLFLLQAQYLRRRGQVFFAALVQTVISIFVWTLAMPFTQEMTTSGQIVWAVLLPAQLALLLVLLINGLELTEMLWTKTWRRLFQPIVGAPDAILPKVSIHLPIHNEPPEMVRETLNALARLDYPDFEILVIDNNTKDEAVWKPIEAHCARLGERFRFFHLPNWPGYKAGALNFALEQTAPDAEVIGVIDSDYVVRPDWLRSCTPYFVSEKVAVVQAPQDNRAWENDLFKTMINWEYFGFFQLGMVQRNERNAIIQHGTMTLVRRTALEEVKGWSTWTICEDAELGLRLFNLGYDAVYVNDSFGKGLVPDSFAGYKVQRLRWAYGAVQILKGHWSQLWGGKGSNLTLGQRFHFLSGWFPWFADAVHMIFTFAGAFWTIGLIYAPHEFGFPVTMFLIPTLGVFLFKVAQPLWLYRRKIGASMGDTLGAALAGMSLTHTIARAIFQGLFIKGKPFMRTPKGEDKPAAIQGLYQAWEETLMFGMLLVAIVGTGMRFGLQEVEPLVWMLMLGIQSIPYAAALMVSLSNTVPAFRRVASRAAVPALG